MREWTTGRTTTGMAAVAAVGLAVGLAAGVGPAAAAPPGSPTPGTTVTVRPDRTGGTVSPLLLGGAGHWAYDGFGGWKPGTQTPYPGFLKAQRQAGITAVRYPGGTIANLYHWKQAIGPFAQRVDQVHGATGEPLGNNVGPDEFGKLSEKLGQRDTITTNFSTGTPAEAADWVEYMTGRVGQNPNGGIDWAAVRAKNGHPQPYDIPYWEVGNEMSSGGQLYWRGGQSATDPTTLYTFGGSTSFTKQRVGKHSDYRGSAAVSDGSANQSFVAKYAPITAGSAHVYVGGQEWTRTSGLASASASAQVFTLDEASGKITFGDGTHGVIPAKGSVVTISYTSGPHPGFTAFYAAMKQANPNIHVCAGLSGANATVKFAQLMGTAHPYDCVEHHSYITDAIPTNLSVDEYHSRLMLDVPGQVADIRKIQHAIDANAGSRASQIKVEITEYGNLGSRHPDADPNYHASLSQAILMANDLAAFIKLGIPAADKSNLNGFVFAPPPGGSVAVSSGLNAMIAGPGPTFELAPTGLVPEMVKPMTGGTVVASSVAGNPTRTLGDGQQLPALTTVASRASNGALDVLVINQDPENDVRSTVQPGVTHAAAVQVTTLNGTTILSRNLPGDQRVTIRTSTAQVGRGAFTYTFPAHSVTRIHLTGAGTAAPSYRVTGTVDVGTPIAGLDTDPALGVLFTVDGRRATDGDPTDDATLSTIDVANRHIIRKDPIYAGISTVAVDPTRSRLYLAGDSVFAAVDEHKRAYLNPPKVVPDHLGPVALDRFGGGLIGYVQTPAGNVLCHLPDSGCVPTGDRPTALAASSTANRQYALTPTGLDVLSNLRVVTHLDVHASGIALDESRHLIFLDNGSTVTALDDRTFTPVKTGQVTGTITDLAVDPTQARLYIAGSHGLTVADEHTGNIIATLTTLGPLGHIAVNTTRHEIYAATGTTVTTIGETTS